MILVFLGVPLLVLCALFAVNTHLNGTLTEATETVLGLLILAVCIATFIRLDWRWGVGSVIASFVGVAVLQLPARHLARFLRGY